jgi:hypothetical protein
MGRGTRGALLACAVFLVSLVVFAPTPASAAAVPRIIDAQAKDMTEHSAALEAQVDPEGGQTTVELWLECQDSTPGRGACEPVTGGPHTQTALLPAQAGTQMLTVEMTGLQPGYEYTYRVAAVNSAGRVQAISAPNFETVTLGGCAKGCPYTSSVSLASIEGARIEAERIFAEAEAARQAAREQKERQLREEDAARYAAELAALKRREEEEAPATAPPPAARCVVPRLKGDTLSVARSALAREHCRLGKVHWPRHRRGSLRVLAQGVAHGHSLAAGSPVAVTLGRERSRHG